MKLYHGSNLIVDRIDLSKGKDFKDFGRGFYLTRDYSRAVAMAQRTTAIEAVGSPEVTPYVFLPSTCPKDLKIKVFEMRTAEWALFVLNNRDKHRVPPFRHDYDIVVGPVADSRVDSILMEYKRTYGGSFMKAENLRLLARQLKYPGSDYVQYCFCTTKAIDQLILDL